MITILYAQDMEIGPVRVDTGNDWLDFAFAMAAIIIIIFIWKQLGRR